MKYLYATFIFLVVVNLASYSQTNFETGFKIGFRNGYCYTNKSSNTSCTPPLPPLAPLPQINESKNSYQDGYNRGFLYGQSKRSKDDASLANSNANSPKFNPYIPQSPIASLTSQERAVYYSNKAGKEQAIASSIVNLLGLIFNSSGQGKASRSQKKAYRQLLKQKKKEFKIKKKEFRKKYKN